MNNSFVIVVAVGKSGGVSLNRLTIINSIKCGRVVLKNRLNSCKINVARKVLCVQNLIRDG